MTLTFLKQNNYGLRVALKLNNLGISPRFLKRGRRAARPPAGPRGGAPRGYITNSTGLPNFVKFYKNSDLEKEIILNDNKNKSGIYLWLNNITNHMYIGSSQDLNRRFMEYFRYSYLIHPARGKSIVCRSLVKNGYSNFSIAILEYCDKDNLTSREQYYINLLNPEYNIVLQVTNTHTPEAIQKMKLAKLNKDPNLPGRKQTDYTKKLLSNIAKNRKFNPSIPTYVYTKEGLFLLTFPTIIATAAYFNVSQSTVRKYLDSERLFKKEFYLKSSEQVLSE